MWTVESFWHFILFDTFTFHLLLLHSLHLLICRMKRNRGLFAGLFCWRLLLFTVLRLITLYAVLSMQLEAIALDQMRCYTQELLLPFLLTPPALLVQKSPDHLFQRLLLSCLCIRVLIFLFLLYLVGCFLDRGLH